MQNGKLQEGKRENPFFHAYHTPHDTAPFDRIRTADYKEAVTEGIRRQDEEIRRITDNPTAPDFDNTVVALEDSGALLDRVCNVFFNLLSAETSDEMDALAQELSPLLSEHSNNIHQNERLFARIKAVKDGHPALNPEQQMLLDTVYSGFVRSGATLQGDARRRFRDITMQLSKLSLQFSQNNLKDTNNFALHLTTKDEVAGLPDSALEAAALEAHKRGQEGWTFTLHAPSYQPFMMYADRRDLREKLYRAYNTLGVKGDEYDNREIVRSIVNLRMELARLLGYKTYADYVLERRMAGDTAHVYKLLDELLDAYLPKAREEVAEVAATARKAEGADFTLMPWDFGYYAHKLKLEKYNLDPEMLRPYFELSRVKKGVFGLATKLYGITFRENKDIPVYNPEVTAYEVYDKDGSFLAVLYADFHPRESKRSGAWMTSYKDQWKTKDGVDSRPHVSVTMNLTKPTGEKPALLTLGEVETFLHEFGHALHGMFADTTYQGLSGTNVYWDFVELPSQFMENYAVEKDFLHTFAVHYKTGEPLPDELIGRILKSRNFNVAYACVRQVSFGLLDMAYYTRTEPLTEDIEQFEQEAWKRAQVLPHVPGTCMSTQFSHIMAGGYAAGYYSYKWAEVLDADAFSVFKAHGVFDRATAQRFRDEVLSRGGTEDPMTLYKRFRGQEPTIDALLKRNGLKA